MKYNYIISGSGNIDDEAIISLLQSNGLNDVYIEKFIDAESYIADQSDLPLQDIDEKLEKLTANETAQKYGLTDLFCRRRSGTNISSMRDLAQYVYNCCIEKDIGSSYCGLILYRIISSIQ